MLACSRLLDRGRRTRLRVVGGALGVAALAVACAPGPVGRRPDPHPAGADAAWGRARADAAERQPVGEDAAVEAAAGLLAAARGRREAGDAEGCAEAAARAAGTAPAGDAGGAGGALREQARALLLEGACRREAGQAGAALRAFARAWPTLGGRAERAYAARQIEEIALHGLRASEAAALEGRLGEALAEAWLGVRLALVAVERGDGPLAAARLERARARLAEAGVAPAAAGPAWVDAEDRVAASGGTGVALGAILPLSGPLHRVGLSALQGLLLASGAIDDRPGVTLLIEDSGGSADGARAAVARLAARPEVAGVVGPIDRRAAAAAAAEAQARGLPLVTLSVAPDVTAAGTSVFRNFLDVAGEAAGLARHAVRDRGLLRVAVLRPDNGYGRELEALFAQAVRAEGGEVVQARAYAPGPQGKAAAVRELIAGPAFDALFLPDTAEQVAMLAPYLAAAAAAVAPAGGGAGRGPLLLGPGAWADRALVAHGAGRYLDGAVFAAGWWPESGEAETIRLVARLNDAGVRPDAFAAFAYDSAVRLARAAAAGAGRADGALGGREGVRRALAEGPAVPGPVATRAFGPDRNPAGGPLLVRVTEAGFEDLGRPDGTDED